MAFTYARVGPPFSFQGTFTRSQWNAFKAWIEARSANFATTQQFHQMRAQQLRKAAGLLERFYSYEATEPLAPTFTKTAWTASPDGHFPSPPRHDHDPGVMVGELRAAFQPAMELQEEAVFHMNHLRAQIEREEDMAQYASEALAKVSDLVSRIEGLFGQPEYQATLVDDLNDLFDGEPRYRVHPLDTPTPFEKAIRNKQAFG
jgi:hypothetical protein